MEARRIFCHNRGESARESYPSDLTDEQWPRVSPLIPKAKSGGRRRGVQRRQILNGIFYVLRSGCAWRLLPHEFGPWQTVYHYFRQFRRDGTWEKINSVLRTSLRQAEGRNPQPSAAIIDSQSIKTTETRGERGYDAGKKVKGRKRHILVDTMGLLLMVVVHVASLPDCHGAKLVFLKVKAGLGRLSLIWADGAYSGDLIDWVKEKCQWVLSIVKKPADTKGFLVLPRRWVVERTFAWLGRYRRLSKDYEQLPETSEAFVYAAMIHIMVRRLA